jgi:hypothetical protein
MSVAEGAPPGRCGYVWPGGHEDGDDPDRRSCCYRPTLADSGRCVWHTDPEDTGGKSPDAMRAARLDPDEEPGRTSEGGSFVELLAGADLSGANLSAADLSGARLDRATFADATLLELGCTDGHLIGTDLSGPSVERAGLNRAELLGADLVGARLYGALLGDARIDRGTRLWPDGGVSWRRLVGRDGSDAGSLRHRLGTVLRRGRRPYCAYDPRYARDDGEPDVGRAAEVYGRLESLARDNSLPRLASECSLGRKDVQFMQCRRHGDLLMTLRSLVPNLVARYGETPLRVLGSGATTVLVCGLVYRAFGLVARADGAGEPATLFENLYFSALTFTTLVYGDFSPVEPAGRLLAVAETSAGVVLLAILVFVFGRRTTR